MKYTEKFWSGLGMALTIFSVLLGIGGCIRIADDKGPLIVIQTKEAK